MRGFATDALRLIAHELRLQHRRNQVRWNRSATALLLVALAAVGVSVPLLLRQNPFSSDVILSAASAGAIYLSLLFFSNALMAGSKLVAVDTDLPLLMTSPVSLRLIIATKLLGIAAAAIIAYGLPLLLLTLPFAVTVQPRLLGIIATLPLLALGASAAAVSLIAFLYTSFGGERARVFASILAAVSGGLFFWFFLETREAGGGFDAGKALASLPATAENLARFAGSAVTGSAGPWLLLAIVSTVMAVGTVAAAQRAFAAGVEPFQSTSRSRRRFWAGSVASTPFRAVLVKEVRNLVRDSEVLFKLGLRIVYVTPLAYIIARDRTDDPFVLVAAAAFVLGQLASSIGWLLHSGEAYSDLLSGAPASRRAVTGAKIVTSVLPSALLALLAGAFMIGWHPVAGMAAIITTLVIALAAGSLEAVLAKPGSREMFVQNKDLSVVNTFLSLALCAGLAVFGAWIARISAEALI